MGFSRTDDGRFMCAYCFDYFSKSELVELEGGERVDVCWPCWRAEQSYLEAGSGR